VTAETEQNAAAAESEAMAESQAAAHVETRSPSDSAVQWTEPRETISGVSPQPTPSPNVSDPTDNSQSQG
jgi:hypothetical protein